MNTLHETPDRSKMVRDMYIYTAIRRGSNVLEMFARKEHAITWRLPQAAIQQAELDQLFTSHQFTVKDHIEIKISRRTTFQIVRYIKN